MGEIGGILRLSGKDFDKWGLLVTPEKHLAASWEQGGWLNPPVHSSLGNSCRFRADILLFSGWPPAMTEAGQTRASCSVSKWTPLLYAGCSELP
jgi:hypothetical protein